MPLLLAILIWTAAIYLLLWGVFYFLQDYFFFRPEILPSHFEYRYPFPFEEVDFDMEDGGQINGIHFKVPNSKGVVFYFKGNSKSIKGWGKFARDFISKGYDFFLMDYRGFGKSMGKRTETALYNDGQFVYKWLTTQYPEEKIIIYGRSLGSGIAARIASWNRPKLLLLDSPYYSFIYHIKRFGFFLPLKWLLKYKIRTNQFLKKISCPVFILHGTNDRLIPFKDSELLQAANPDMVHVIPLEGGGHNNLPQMPEYHEWLYDILNDEELFDKLARGDDPKTLLVA
jgi:alpha-beta hydrolase superfamily lysophospholipase